MIRLTLENLNKKASVDLLGQNVSAKDLKGLDGLDQIYSYGTGFFSAESISIELTEKLRNKQYDFVLIPVANNHMPGYQNVLEVAETILPKEILYVYPEGRLQPASPVPISH